MVQRLRRRRTIRWSKSERYSRSPFRTNGYGLNKAASFHLQDDPDVLDLKDLIDAEIIQMDPAELPASSLAEATVAFRVGPSAPRAATGGRKVTAKFMAKAPASLPSRVAPTDANGEGVAGAPPDGKGIVRVR